MNVLCWWWRSFLQMRNRFWCTIRKRMLWKKNDAPAGKEETFLPGPATEWKSIHFRSLFSPPPNSSYPSTHRPRTEASAPGSVGFSCALTGSRANNGEFVTLQIWEHYDIPWEKIPLKDNSLCLLLLWRGCRCRRLSRSWETGKVPIYFECGLSVG